MVMMLLLLLWGGITADSCPAGMTQSEGILRYSSTLKLECHNSVTYVQTLNKQINRIFAVQLWVQHTACLTGSLGDIRTLFYKPNHLELIYNTSQNAYLMTIKNEESEAKLNTSGSMIIKYNKWLHLTITNDVTNGFSLYLYGDQIIQSLDFVSFSNPYLEKVYIGTSYPVDQKRFSGYIKEFRIWSKGISPSEAKQNYDREITSNIDFVFLNTYLQFAGIQNSVYNNDFRSSSWANYSAGLNYVREHNDPVCCKASEDCSKRKFNGITCENKNPKYLFFDGFYYLPLRAFFSSSRVYTSSFWFKFIPRPSSNSNSLLFAIEKLFSIEYDRSIGSDDDQNSMSLIRFRISSTSITETTTVSRLASHWTQVIASLNTSDGSYNFNVVGAPIPTVSGSGAFTISSGTHQLPIYIGGSSQTNLFTGFVRELAILSKDYQQALDLLLLRRQLPFSRFVSNFLLLYAPLTEGSGVELNLVRGYETDTLQFESLFSIIQWRADLKSTNLCPPDLTPVNIFNDQRVCCAESYLYLNGFDTSLPSLSLPNPTSPGWTTQGSLCFYIFSGNTLTVPPDNHNILVQWLPLNISYSYGSQYMTIYLQRETEEMTQLSFNFTGGVWDALCFSFSVSSSTVQGFIYEASNKLTVDTAPPITPISVDFTPTNILQFLPGYSTVSFGFKNVMILTKVISYDEFHLLYWGNAKLYPHIGNILAFWPLNESESFHEEIEGRFAFRNGSTTYAGPSTRVSELTYTNIEKEYNSELPRADFWLTLSSEDNIRPVRKSLILYSIDFAQVRGSGYLQPLILGGINSSALMAEGQGRTPTSIISDYHGIKIPGTASYQSNYIAFNTPISSGGISFWFYSTSSFPTPLLSSWSVDSGTFFTYYFSLNLIIEIIPATDTHPLPLSVNNWHHLLIFWKTNSVSFDSVTALDAVTKDAKTLAISSTILDNSPRIILGAKYTGTTIDTMSIFSGYIRRVELLSYSAFGAPMSAIGTYALQIEKLFLADTECNTEYNACTYCDIFTKKCFPTVTHENRPDNSGACLPECDTTFHTSCNIQGTCSACNNSLCFSCTTDNICLRCKEGASEDGNGNCICDKQKALNINTKECESCDSTCASCLSPNNATECTSCSPTKSLNLLSSINKTGVCLDECPVDTIKNGDGICVIKCDSTCLTCASSNNKSSCTSCVKNLFFIGNETGSCEIKCPANSVQVEGKFQCIYCDSSCATCLYSKDSSACYTCNSSTPFKTESFLPAIGTCTAVCSPTAYTDYTNHICYEDGDCPITTYTNNIAHSCEPCHFSCFGCKLPNNQDKCMGCSNSSLFLLLEKNDANYGKCVEQCDSKYKINYISRVCIPPKDFEEDTKQAKAITEAINGATTAVTFSSMFSSILLSGNLGAVAALLGPLQLLNLFSIINIPTIPTKLSLFFDGMGIVSFEFLPNAITWFIPDSVTQYESQENELDDNTQYNASLECKLFLVNIGNTITLFLLIGVFSALTFALAPSFEFFRKQKQLLKSFILEFIVLNYMELILSAVVQNRYSNFKLSPFYTVCTVSAILSTGILVFFIVYCWYKIRKHTGELDTESVQQEIGCFFEEYDTSGLKKWSVLCFLGVRCLLCVLIVSNHAEPYAQVGCFAGISVLAFAWTVIIRPQKSAFNFVGAVASEGTALAVNVLYFLLCDPSLSRNEVEQIGDWVFYLFAGIAGVNMITGTGKSIYDFYESCVNLKKEESIDKTSVKEISLNEVENKDCTTKNPLSILKIENSGIEPSENNIVPIQKNPELVRHPHHRRVRFLF